jgi:glycine/D-amino acid oxidase-like deaminating enzyme
MAEQTMTPTEDFVIDHWSGEPRIAFASACSGHGFKFVLPLSGRLIAELTLRGRADLAGADAVSLFALRRLAPATAPSGFGSRG